MSRDLRAFAEQTGARSAAEARVLERVLDSAPEVLNCGALIREIPASVPGAEQRVLSRLRRTQLQPEATWRPLVVPAFALAAAAAALLVLPALSDQSGADDGGQLAALTTPPQAPIAAAQAPIATAQAPSELAPVAFDGGGDHLAVQGLALTYDGKGQLGGRAEAPVIHWSRGSIRVEVDPGQGMNLEVVTDEGTVRVLGTVFTVERDALGTRVSVERGKVAFDCAGGASSQLTAGAEGVCLPVTAAGMLGRGRTLQAGGAGTETVLDSVDAGQRLAGYGDFDWRELQALRIQTLLADKQLDAGCAAALDYPGDASDPRAAELEAILASAWCVKNKDR